MVLDFIIGGAPKCGTTALFRYLDQHPAVFTTHPKEPHYFASAALGRPVQYDYSRATYEALFRGRRPGQVAGEGSTEYLQHAEAVAPLLAATVPDVRLIFLLRDPVERAYSYYWYRLHLGVIGAGTPFSDYRKKAWLLKAGDYASTLRVFYDHIASAQVLVLLSEDLRYEPRATLRRVCRHIGVGPSFEFDLSASPNTTRYPRALRLTAAAGRRRPGCPGGRPGRLGSGRSGAASCSAGVPRSLRWTPATGPSSSAGTVPASTRSPGSLGGTSRTGSASPAAAPPPPAAPASAPRTGRPACPSRSPG